jgi:hypothetical protein
MRMMRQVHELRKLRPLRGSLADRRSKRLMELMALRVLLPPIFSQQQNRELKRRRTRKNLKMIRSRFCSISEMYGSVPRSAELRVMRIILRKTASDQESPVMTSGHYIFPRSLGMTSALSRNRCVRRSLWSLHMVEHSFTVLGNQAKSFRYGCVLSIPRSNF